MCTTFVPRGGSCVFPSTAPSRIIRVKEEGIFEETQAQAIKEVVAWQLAEAMKQKNISKNKMATLLQTSGTQVDRLLDPTNDITLGSLQRAAAMVGRRVNVELV